MMKPSVLLSARQVGKAFAHQGQARARPDHHHGPGF